MQTIAAQLSALAVTDTLKHAAVPGTLTNIPWQVAVGSWSEAAGWSPSAFTANPPTNTRSGLYLNTGKQSGDHAVGLKKTTGSLAAAERQFEVWMCSAMGAKPSGYQLAVITNKTSNGKVRFVLRRFIEGEGITLYESTEELPFNENDSFYLAKVGAKLLVYYRSGEGTPTLVGGAVDATFTEGFAGFGGNGSNPRLINFTVGALTVSTEVKRIRTFTTSGTGVHIPICAIGACNRLEDVTMVALVRLVTPPSISETPAFITIGGSARGFRLNLGYTKPDTAATVGLQWLENEGTSTNSRTASKIFTYDDHWKLVVARKEVGAKKADLGVYDFVTREWTWEEGNEGAAAKAESQGAEGTVWLGSANGFGEFNGDMPACMIGPVMSRAAVEALAKVEALVDWRPSASGLWLLNKATIGEKVEDETGNGANQTNTPTLGSVTAEGPPIPYYVPSPTFARPLVGGVIKFVKRWIRAKGAIRRG